MRRARATASVIGSVLLFRFSAAGAQSPPSALADVRIDATVSYDPATKIYTYRYKITNPPRNTLLVSSITLDLTLPPGASQPRKLKKLPAGIFFENPEKLTGPKPAEGTRRATWSDQLRKSTGKDFVAVGLDGPRSWGPYGVVSTHSWALLPKIIGASWTDEGQESAVTRIAPGHSLEGFVVTSFGPPGIRSIELQPPVEELAESRKLPGDWIGDSGDSDEVLSAKKKRQHTLGFVTRTLGPTALPDGITSAPLLARLRGLVDQCADLSWITDPQLLQQLRGLLTETATALQDGTESTAHSQLEQFETTVTTASSDQRLREASDLLSLNARLTVDVLSGNSPLPGHGPPGPAPDEEEEVEAELPAPEACKPDLTLGHLRPPAVKLPSPTGTVTIDETTVNIGSAPAPASKTRYYLSSGMSGDAKVVVLGERQVPPLQPKEVSASVGEFALPALAPGVYWVLACADAGYEVEELDETNNCRTLEVMIPALMDAAPR